VSGDDVILPFPGKAVVLKMDAGVIPSRNLIDEINAAFWEHWLSHSVERPFPIRKATSWCGRSTSERGKRYYSPSLVVRTPSTDTLMAQQRRALFSTFLDEESLLPPLHLYPLVVDAFGWASSSPITRFYSVLTGAGQVLLVTGMRLHCYCCYAVPCYELVHAGLYHPDFAADKQAMSAGMSGACTTGTVAFLPLRTIVWKAVPIGLDETVQQ
jgi:hypothetical protein